MCRDQRLSGTICKGAVKSHQRIQCQFTPTYQSVPLFNRIPCGSGGTSFILRFGLPDVSRPMDLTTCACLLASADLEDDTKENGELTEVVRPYTPISTNDQVGCFDLLIKDYGNEHGWMSNYLCNELQIGEMVRGDGYRFVSMVVWLYYVAYHMLS